MAEPRRRASEKASFPIDWGTLVPLRLKAKAVAEGIYAGTHRSIRKGPGVEFGGHRPYVPGDDLRFFDRRALLRHERLMIREFETETDRAVWIAMDATGSMAYRGGKSPGSKYAYASLLAAALARVALASGDPIGLEWLGGQGVMPLPAMAGREAFERLIGSLEGAAAMGDASADDEAFDRAMAPIARKARRGATVVLFSDLVDLPPHALASFAALATGRRALVAVRVLDPSEAELDFSGQVRLRALEGDVVVETNAEEVRQTYKARLESIAERWAVELESRGGRLVRATSADPPADVVRAIIRAIAEANG